MVEFGEELSDGGRPEASKNFVIFSGADALSDDVGGGGILGDAVAHERCWDKSERIVAATKSFPGVPVDVAFEMGSEDFFWTVFDDKCDSGAADGVAEFEDETFGML